MPRKHGFRLFYLSFKFENKESIYVYFTDDKTSSESYELSLCLGASVS